MRRIYPLLIVCVLAITACQCPDKNQEVKQEPSIVGVWEQISVENLTTGAVDSLANVHYIFTKGYISSIGGAQDRPVIEKNFAKMECDEIKTQLPAGGGFMEYYIKDNKIHRTTIFAMSAYFIGREIITDFELKNDTLTLTDNHHADGNLRRWTFKRLE